MNTFSLLVPLVLPIILTHGRKKVETVNKGEHGLLSSLTILLCVFSLLFYSLNELQSLRSHLVASSKQILTL